MVTKRQSTITTYPRPHDIKVSWNQSIDSANQYSTTLPLIMYNEGLGAPSAYKAHPGHASFAETDDPTCYPEARIDSINAMLNVSLSKAAIETDAVQQVRFGVQHIAGAFEDWKALDDMSAETVEDVLHMQTETTDRQVYPLYNAQNMFTQWASSSLLHANVPGLTASQDLEGDSFDIDAYHDAIQYKSTSPILRKVSSAIKWFTLSRNKTFLNLPIRIAAAAKFMNEYAGQFVRILSPIISDHYQYHTAGDTTAAPHLNITLKCRYNEWHDGFNFERV